MVRKHGSHSVHEIRYHLVFCPKRRKACLVGDISVLLYQIIQDVCKNIGVEILALEIMPDHVHLFVGCGPKLSPNTVVRRVKGRSSNILRKTFPQLLKIPTLWSSSYYCGSVGNVTAQTIKRYIRNQKTA